MTEDLQQEVIAFLADPETHGGERVERISTHGAHIFLAGNRAYKLKRAVKFPFMDYSTLERRQLMVNEEFTINHELAPSLYLRATPVTRTATGRLAFGGTGEVLDWVLVMGRFPQHDLLDDRARRGVLEGELMEPLADALVTLHKNAPVVDRHEAETFVKVAMDNFPPLRATPLDQTLVESVAGVVLRACEEQAQHLETRALQGHVRRGHGDLHLRNIVCLEGNPTPFDAIEFDASLASGDVYYDLAFLLMDLDHRNLRTHGNRLLNRYVAETGDFEGLAGLPLFLAVRALIRAQVAALAATMDSSKESIHFAEAASYLELAATYLPSPPPQIIAVGGLSGTGKSRAAQALAPTLSPGPGAILIRSDTVRKRLHGLAETAQLSNVAYTQAARERVYDTMMGLARRCIHAGYSCILDAVFAGYAERTKAEAVASGADQRFSGFWLEADLNIRVQRIQQRVNDASDADVAVAQQQERYELGDLTWHRVDASQGVVHTVKQILDTVKEKI